MAGKHSRDALEIAIRLLARREHSAFELRRKLAQRGLAGAEIDSAIERLGQQGLQSDQRFAESYVRARGDKAYGPLRIVAELRERGVDDAIIDACLDLDDDAWQQRLHQAHRRKFGDGALADYEDRARRIRYLQYRGFDVDTIQRYLNSI